MPEAPAQSPAAAEQRPDAPSGVPGAAAPTPDTQDGSPDGVAQLAGTLQTLQARHDELLGRFLGLIEERRTLDQALFAERFKTAGLQRDLGIFQREWETARAQLATVQAQNDHHKQLALKLQRQLQEEQNKHSQEIRRFQQELHEIRQSRTWQLSQQYWKLTRRVRGG